MNNYVSKMDAKLSFYWSFLESSSSISILMLHNSKQYNNVFVQLYIQSFQNIFLMALKNDLKLCEQNWLFSHKTPDQYSKSIT